MNIALTQAGPGGGRLDRHVASLLAMTVWGAGMALLKPSLRAQRSNPVLPKEAAGWIATALWTRDSGGGP